MDEQNFDRFDDSTLTMDLTVAEYRALVSFRAVADYIISELEAQVASLEARNKELAEQVVTLQEMVVTEDEPDE